MAIKISLGFLTDKRTYKNRTSKDQYSSSKKVQTRRFNADIRYGLNVEEVNEYFENGLV